MRGGRQGRPDRRVTGLGKPVERRAAAAAKGPTHAGC